MEYYEESPFPSSGEIEKRQLEDRVRFLEEQVEYLIRKKHPWWKWQNKKQKQQFIDKELG